MSDRPRIDDGNKLKDFEKVWNGIPLSFFMRLWLLPFIVALGNVVMDGHSLRDTYNQVDPGANGAGTAAQQQHTQTRNRRIFSILIAHISPNAAVRNYLIQEYNDDGIAAIAYIEQDDVGNIPLQPSVIEEMEEEWIAMNMENSNIVISATCVLDWGNLSDSKEICFKQ